MFINSRRVTQIMDEQGLDGLVATTIGNVFYFTGISSDGLRLYPYEHQSYAVITRNEPTKPIFIASKGLVNQAWMGYKTLKDVVTYGKFTRFGPFDPVELTGDESWLKKVSDQYDSKTSPLEALVYALKEMRLDQASVGIDEMNFQCHYMDELRQRLPSAKITAKAKTFREIRKVKTPAELDCLRQVNQIAENAIIASLGIAREGITEYELAREFDRSVVSQGGRPQFTLIRIGRNGVAGEVEPNQTPLKPGEVIWFDVGLSHGGFWADIARTACLGEPQKRVRDIYNAMLAGEQAALDQTVPGMTGEQLFMLVMNACKHTGVPYYDRHHVGHGIGMELYEDVMIAQGITDIIEEGTVVNIETPYYEFGLGAIHVEDPYVVNADSNTLLTTLSRELLVVG